LFYSTSLNIFFGVPHMGHLSYLRNKASRVKKAPKLYISDSGLACHLTGCTDLADDSLRGALLETYVRQNIDPTSVIYRFQRCDITTNRSFPTRLTGICDMFADRPRHLSSRFRVFPSSGDSCPAFEFTLLSIPVFHKPSSRQALLPQANPRLSLSSPPGIRASDDGRKAVSSPRFSVHPMDSRPPK